MKYTPYELLSFVKEEKLEEALKKAIAYNGRDYHLYRTNGKLLPLNGQMVYDFQVDGLVEPLPLKDYCTPDQIDILISHPECIRSALTFHSGEIGFIFTFSPDKREDEQEAEFWDHVFVNLFTTLQLDTRGRVRGFIDSVSGSSGAPDGGVKVFRPTKPLLQR